jgi:hypothetical protein
MNFVYADEAQNLLHLIFVGTLDRAAGQPLLDAVKRALLPLRPGIVVLSDLRDLKAVDKEALPCIDELMELVNAHGVRKVVRVLPAPTENFGFAIMSLFHYGHDVRFVACLQLEEAVAHLPAGGSAHTPAGPQPPAARPPKASA